MNLSLNEAAAMAKKAARGAGYPWGVAEEASHAVHCLCAHGLDGCGSLARLLSAVDGKALAAWSPDVSSAPWLASGGTLCPLMVGTVLSDCAAHLNNAPIAMKCIAEPVLLLPFIASAARQIDGAVMINGSGFEAVSDGGALSLNGRPEAFADHLTVQSGSLLDTPIQPCTRATPDGAAWRMLDRFASRTYAPATEASRLKGAGAGLSDQD